MDVLLIIYGVLLILLFLWIWTRNKLEKSNWFSKFMDKLFIHKKCYRDLTSFRTFGLVKPKGEEEHWISIEGYKKGDFLKNVDGKYHNAVFCSKCRHELIHSNSFTSYNEENGVEKYTCNHCGHDQYTIWGIIPGYMHCTAEGNI